MACEICDHTPGPWEAIPQRDDTYIVKQPSRHYQLGSVIGTDCGKVVAFGVSAKDAPLLAAAPKLLAACRLAIGFCVHVRQTDPNWAEHLEVGRLFAALQPALAKAIGDSTKTP